MASNWVMRGTVNNRMKVQLRCETNLRFGSHLMVGLLRLLTFSVVLPFTQVKINYSCLRYSVFLAHTLLTFTYHFLAIHAISIRYFSVSLLRYIQSKSIEESVNLFGHDSERSAAQRAVLSAGQKSFQILMLLE